MAMQNINDLLLTGMSYTLDFEQKFAQFASKMADATTEPEVKEVFEKTTTQSKKYADRIESAYKKLGKPSKTEDNHIADAMIREVEGMIANTDKGAVRDAALIVAFNQQQAYRVSSYGSLRSYAKVIGKEDAVQELQQSLDEAKAGDEKLTQIAEQKVNLKAKEADAVAA